jgi:hypothetical protein
MAKRKTTVYVEEEVLRAARVTAARTGKRDSQIVEEALREYVGLGVLERVWGRSTLSEEDALALAYEELHASRE